ncbi:MAG TPA: amidohydrolase [Sphingomicrobium sp.]|nr:amidohydrolase [Sphingomicrobium sp.]
MTDKRSLAMTHRQILAIGALLAASPAFADTGVKSAIKADYDSHLGALFTHFHQNPELSFLEVQTAKRMAAELKKSGAQVTTGVGGTGVVGVMRNGPGPTVLLRADMDGLPMPEKSGLAYASKVTQTAQDGKVYPVTHSCGHDTHITAMVGTARRLAAMKNRWKGTVLFIVQPAEERVGGAKAMLADGLYTRFPKPDYALAFHVAAQLPTGRISASEGLQYSSADSIDVMVPGVGAHGASAHMGKDPVYIASQIVVALQGIASREIGPLEPGVVTVGSFHAGTKHNIISDRADLQITVRANNEKTRAQIIAAVGRIAQGVARANGMPEDKLPVVTVSEGTPTTINHAPLAKRLNASLARDLGQPTLVPFEQTGMGAEDFAYFVQPNLGVQGYYFAVGGTPQAAFDAEKAGGPPVPSHHSPLFKIAPEPAVTLGTEAMVMATLELLKR